MNKRLSRRSRDFFTGIPNIYSASPYSFPTDICVPNSPIIEYGRRILSKPLLTTTDPRCPASSFTDHKSTLFRPDFQSKIPNSGFFYGLSGHSIYYSVSRGVNVTYDLLKKWFNSKKVGDYFALILHKFFGFNALFQRHIYCYHCQGG
jgi:hypothetical protein